MNLEWCGDLRNLTQNNVSMFTINPRTVGMGRWAAIVDGVLRNASTVGEVAADRWRPAGPVRPSIPPEGPPPPTEGECLASFQPQATDYLLTAWDLS